MEQPKVKKQRGFKPGVSGNPAGRPKKNPEERAVRVSAKALKDRELLMLLRKIRPHVSESIKAAVDIMKDEDAQDHNKLKAATILLDNYRKMVLDLYGPNAGDEDDGKEAEEIQQNNAAVFSLTVIEGDKEE